MLVQSATVEACGGRNADDGLGIDQRPVEGSGQLSLDAQSNTFMHQAHPGRIDLNQDGPSWTYQLANPSQQPDRIAADPDIAVCQQSILPAAFVGHVVKDTHVNRDRAAFLGQFHGDERDVDPQSIAAARGQCTRKTACTAADIKRRAHAAVQEQRMVRRVGRTRPLLDI
ncbi:MAG: hypothetical protein L0G69_14165 [Brevibacterium sp.]|nr:hypothetical protein [Brevibacterium sp.]